MTDQLPTWRYEVSNDQMRGRKQWTASLAASNPAQLDFPYEGGSPAFLTIFQGEKDNPFNQQVLMKLENGQIECGTSCDFAIKFDNGPVIITSGTKNSCGERECVNLGVTSAWHLTGKEPPLFDVTKALLKSKRVVLEVPLYKTGHHQFVFNTAGLVWPQPGAPTHGDGDSVRTSGDPSEAKPLREPS